MKVILVGDHPHFVSLVQRIRQIDEKIDIMWIHPSQEFAIFKQGLPYFTSDIIYKEKNLSALTPDMLQLVYRVDLKLGHSVDEINVNQRLIREKDTKGTIVDVSFDYLLISQESSPIVHEELKEVPNQVYTLNSLQAVKRFKKEVQNSGIKRVLVCGEGKESVVIGENLRELGLRVTILSSQKTWLPCLDSHLASFVQNYAIDQGISIITNDSIQSIHQASSSMELHIQLSQKQITTDAIVISPPKSSKKKNLSSLLNTEKTNIRDKNIYFIDTDFDLLSLRDNSLNGLLENIKKEQILKQTTNQNRTLIKFFDYEIGSVGETAMTASDKGIPIHTTYTHIRHHDSFYPGSQMMVIQLNVHRETGRLLGAQLVGHLGVDKRLDLFEMAIHHQKTITDLLAYTPTYDLTLSSSIDGFTQAIRHANRVFHQELKEVTIEEIGLGTLKSVYIIDVRDKELFTDAHIPNAHSIPLMKLRQQLEKIPKNKQIVVYSQTGIQSEIAVDILKNHGFDAYHLAGDFRLYDTVYMVSECPTCNE